MPYYEMKDLVSNGGLLLVLTRPVHFTSERARRVLKAKGVSRMWHLVQLSYDEFDNLPGMPHSTKLELRDIMVREGLSMGSTFSDTAVGFLKDYCSGSYLCAISMLGWEYKQWVLLADTLEELFDDAPNEGDKSSWLALHLLSRFAGEYNHKLVRSRWLNEPIERLGINTDGVQALKSKGFKKVGHLVKITETDLINYRITWEQILLIKAELEKRGLHLGMLSHKPRVRDLRALK